MKNKLSGFLKYKNVLKQFGITIPKNKRYNDIDEIGDRTYVLNLAGGLNES